jgi:hypothetical protein
MYELKVHYKLESFCLLPPIQEKNANEGKSAEGKHGCHVFFLAMCIWPLCFVCTHIFDFAFDFYSQKKLIAAPMQSERLSRGRIMQLHL